MSDGPVGIHPVAVQARNLALCGLRGGAQRGGYLVGVKKLLLVLLACSWMIPLMFAGCSGDSYSPPPHSSWQERSEYCYSIVVDPRGSSNTMVGYSDQAVLVVTDAGYVVQATDVRIDQQRTSRYKDYYTPYITWATDGDGYVDIQGCKPTPVEVR